MKSSNIPEWSQKIKQGDLWILQAISMGQQVIF